MMQQQTRQVLTENWDQAKDALRSEFPDLTDQDFDQSDPNAFVAAAASKTGQPQESIEQRLDRVAQQIKSRNQS